MNRERSYQGAHSSCRTNHMANLRFAGTDSQLHCMRTKDLLDCPHFGHIVKAGTSPMCLNVIDVLWRRPCIV
jgi:hypothetical protein